MVQVARAADVRRCAPHRHGRRRLSGRAHRTGRRSGAYVGGDEWASTAISSIRGEADGALAARLGVAGRFVISYCGTVGLAHGLEGGPCAPARCWRSAGRRDVVFLIAGDGGAPRRPAQRRDGAAARQRDLHGPARPARRPRACCRCRTPAWCTCARRRLSRPSCRLRSSRPPRWRGRSFSASRDSRGCGSRRPAAAVRRTGGRGARWSRPRCVLPATRDCVNDWVRQGASSCCGELDRGRLAARYLEIIGRPRRGRKRREPGSERGMANRVDRRRRRVVGQLARRSARRPRRPPLGPDGRFRSRQATPCFRAAHRGHRHLGRRAGRRCRRCRGVPDPAPPLPLLLTGGVREASGRSASTPPAVAAIFGVGLLDDIHRVAPGSKLLVHVSASCLVVAAGLSFCHPGDSSGAPMHPPYPIGCSIVTVLWVVGVTNAFNFMDGLDGLLAGVAAIITGCLAGLAVLLGDPLSAAAALILCGGCLGFLRHNRWPARIFLGDSGSLVIGFVVACISVSVASSVEQPCHRYRPAADARHSHDRRAVRGARAIRRGWVKLAPGARGSDDEGRSPAPAFLLVEITKYRNAVWILYGLVAFFCLLALSVAVTNLHALAVGTLIAELVVVALLRRAHYARR